MSLIRLKRFDEAIACLREMAARYPDSAPAQNNLGSLLAQSGQHGEAIECFRRAIALRPDYPEAHSNMGAALEELQKLDEAQSAYRRAIALRPDYFEAHVNLSNVLRKLHQPDEAIAAARRATQLRGRHPAALNSLGAAYLEKADVEQAMAVLRRAVELEPNFASAHVNLATALLISGNYEEGWQHYAWRCDGNTATHAPQPWGGWVDADLCGKRILVRGEGGLGNVIQFARYVPLIAARGGSVIIECQPGLVSLLKTIKGVAAVIARGSTPPAADVAVPLRCLPQLFATTMENIPTAAVPYLRPDEQRVEMWRQRLRERALGFRVGVCWQGSQALVHQRDRSFACAQLLPLARMAGVTLVSLQVGAAPDEAVPMVTLPDPCQQTDDMMDLAAAISNLDLVITCDTSIAHLAGALGKPVWVALRFASDWRWMLGRTDSPWYPTMKLFRQRQAAEWASVFGELEILLSEQRTGCLARDHRCGGIPRHVE